MYERRPVIHCYTRVFSKMQHCTIKGCCYFRRTQSFSTHCKNYIGRYDESHLQRPQHGFAKNQSIEVQRPAAWPLRVDPFVPVQFHTQTGSQIANLTAVLLSGRFRESRCPSGAIQTHVSDPVWGPEIRSTLNEPASGNLKRTRRHPPLAPIRTDKQFFLWTSLTNKTSFPPSFISSMVCGRELWPGVFG